MSAPSRVPSIFCCLCEVGVSNGVNYVLNIAAPEDMEVGIESIIFKLKRKVRTWTGTLTSDLQISSLALYHLSYPG